MRCVPLWEFEKRMQQISNSVSKLPLWQHLCKGVPKLLEERNPSVFSTISPIIVRTVHEEKGKLRIHDLYPTDIKFYENLRSNLIKKYKKLYNEERENILFSKPFSTKFMRIQIKNTYHRASLMVFEAKGDRKLLMLGYETGFGEKNSMGFGMVKVVK